ncbi:hypothetical protein HaLaN_13722 [Haematococcus lacustris]|uniref:Uncharacterized protein n=1 Tax=Haematococcus lacustris TaxID=44745 RepID=A0A699ZDA0_HAELA|nr:hypothetical protein HaLaN_13722 [Haematococcus lacustris]
MVATVCYEVGLGQDWAVSVTSASTKQAMPIVVSGSRVTLVSSPGVEYVVTVRSIDNVSFLSSPSQTVMLKVDGKAIGYTALLRAQRPSYKFTGYMGQRSWLPAIPAHQLQVCSRTNLDCHQRGRRQQHPGV